MYQTGHAQQHKSMKLMSVVRLKLSYLQSQCRSKEWQTGFLIFKFIEPKERTKNITGTISHHNIFVVNYIFCLYTKTNKLEIDFYA